MDKKFLLTWIVGPSTPSSPISFMISLWKVSCLLASRTLGSSFSWNSKGTVSQGPCRWSTYLPENSCGRHSWPSSRPLWATTPEWWRFYLTTVVEDIPGHLLVSCVIQHSRLMTFLPDNGCGRLSWPSSRPVWSSTPDWWLFYLTIVAEYIPDHLLVLGEPTLQVDGVFTWPSSRKKTWPSSRSVWSSTP
jgi:hypothetical protein